MHSIGFPFLRFMAFVQVGSDANCTKPICCRNFADHTGPVGVPAGPLGSRGCDTPTSLVQSMLQAVSSKNTQFSIFTGDVVEGKVTSSCSFTSSSIL